MAEQAVVGGVGMVPIVGSPLAVAFAVAMGWTHNRRMAAWLDELAEAVTDLQDEHGEYLTLDDLAANDTFVDAVINATRAAQATHQEEKLEALRNGVVNSIGPDAPSADEQARFFRLIEQFTPAHVRLLTFLDNPEAWFLDRQIPIPSYMGGSLAQLIGDGMPEFRDEREWLMLIAADLQSARLLARDITGMMTGPGLWERSTTDLGRRLLAFVKPR